jgi:hypothetical protein
MLRPCVFHCRFRYKRLESVTYIYIHAVSDFTSELVQTFSRVGLIFSFNPFTYHVTGAYRGHEGPFHHR